MDFKRVSMVKFIVRPWVPMEKLSDFMESNAIRFEWSEGGYYLLVRSADADTVARFLCSIGAREFHEDGSPITPTIPIDTGMQRRTPFAQDGQKLNSICRMCGHEELCSIEGGGYNQVSYGLCRTCCGAAGLYR